MRKNEVGEQKEIETADDRVRSSLLRAKGIPIPRILFYAFLILFSISYIVGQ